MKMLYGNQKLLYDFSANHSWKYLTLIVKLWYNKESLLSFGCKSMRFLASSVTPPSWITTRYFFQSMPFVAVSIITVFLCQRFGLSNRLVTALSSLFIIPWVIKPIFTNFS